MDLDINEFDNKLLNEVIYHSTVFYLFIILAGIAALDVMTTRTALLDPSNMEGNPFMAPFLSYAPHIKIIYLFIVFIVANYLEDRRKNAGTFLLIVNCFIAGSIVINNILILNGIYLF